MNFFEHQDRARRQTTQLVLLFTLAVAGIIVGLYLASRIVLRYALSNSAGAMQFGWWDPGAFAVVAVGGVLFILLLSLYKTSSLRGGGSAVARMLGARPVRRDTKDPAERRFLNIVEEMAIASGVPVPQVFVMENEKGINAFAAGYAMGDAAVTVTRGCLEQLTRDELQGVIAHEFSHILNGDMRMNVRLIGILFGILAIGIIGGVLARVGAFRGGSRRSNASALAIAGVLLLLIGYIGTFVGRLIQAAVCRQREYLADASAVQFTRNPSGIAGALKKIGGLKKGSRIEAPEAQQASHLFFSQGVKLSAFSGLLATHPPLLQRIRRIEPDFDGKIQREGRGAAAAAGAAAGMGLSGGGEVRVKPDAVPDRVGRVSDRHLAVSASILDAVPDAVRGALQTPEGAASVVAGLLLDETPEERTRQTDAIRSTASARDLETMETMRKALDGLDARVRLPLVDLAMPSLRDLDEEARARFLRRVDLLVEADRKVTLFEFGVRWLLHQRLARDARAASRVRVRSLDPVLVDVAELLGALARAGHPGHPDDARAAFQAGASRIADPGRVSLPFRPDEPPSRDALGRALDRLSHASFDIRRRVVDACAHTALADRTVTAAEAELLRVLSTAIDCPLPPFVEAA